MRTGIRTLRRGSNLPLLKTVTGKQRASMINEILMGAETSVEEHGKALLALTQEGLQEVACKQERQ